jgi:hypothetical protein
MGFVQSTRTSTSHEKWTATINGKKRIVTVDCPKAPFTKYLLKEALINRKFSGFQRFSRSKKIIAEIVVLP